MFSLKNIVIWFFACAAITAGIMVLNDTYIYIRMKELKLYLHEADKKESNIDHIGLVMKYNLHHRLYEKQINKEKADEIEYQINDIISLKSKNQKIDTEEIKYSSLPALYIINFNRFLIGKMPITDVIEETGITHLDIAYYCERNNLYKKALDNYYKALDEKEYEPYLISSIKLHQGFCYALLGDYERARKKYLEIINNFKFDSVVVTATILLRYLDGFKNELDKLRGQKKSSFEISKKLYHLLAYEESLEILDKLEYNVKPQELAKIRYYKARCLEGLGKKEKAVDTYLRIIISKPECEYSKHSNRRVFLIGSLISNDNNIKTTSIKLNKILKDSEFSKLIKSEHISQYKLPAYSELNPVEIDSILYKRVDKLTKDLNKKSYLGELVDIVTNDGNIFIGKMFKEDKNNIFLNTLIGKVTILKYKIKKISIHKSNGDKDQIKKYEDPDSTFVKPNNISNSEN